MGYKCSDPYPMFVYDRVIKYQQEFQQFPGKRKAMFASIEGKLSTVLILQNHN
jgi:hypothetical protein